MDLNSPVNMMLPQDKRKARPDALSAPHAKKRAGSDASREDKTPLEGSSAIYGHSKGDPPLTEDEDNFLLVCEAATPYDSSEDKTPLEGSSAFYGHSKGDPPLAEDEETFSLDCDTTASDDLSEDETLEGSSTFYGHSKGDPPLTEDEDNFLLVCEAATPYDPSDLLEAVARIRERGCDIDDGEQFQRIKRDHDLLVASALRRAQGSNTCFGKLRMEFLVDKKGDVLLARSNGTIK